MTMQRIVNRLRFFQAFQGLLLFLFRVGCFLKILVGHIFSMERFCVRQSGCAAEPVYSIK